MATTLEIGPALPGDTTDMLEITRDVWEGEDYVPFVWRHWLNDCSGYLMAARENGALVGLQHIEVQPDNVAWFEGIRVSARTRGRGIGRTLLEHGLVWARQRRCRIARLATYSENEASSALAHSAGFVGIQRNTSVEAPAGAPLRQPDDVRVASPADFALVRAILEQQLSVRGWSGTYTEGWTAFTLDDTRLRLLLGTCAVVVHGSPSISGAAIATVTRNRPSLKLGLLTGRVEAQQELALWLRNRAAEVGLPTVRATVHEDEATADALRSSGYSSRHGGAMQLYEMRLDRVPAS